MKMSNLKLIILLLITAVGFLRAQSDTADSLTTTVEDYELRVYDENAHDDYYFKIDHLLQNKINLNNCTIGDLLQVPSIDFATASSIIAYKSRSERIFSVYELYMIPEIDSLTVKMLIPLVCTGFEPIPSHGKNMLKTSPSPIKMTAMVGAFNSSQNNELYTPYILASHSFAAFRIKNEDKYTGGISIEKDPGERNYSDYLSCYFRIQNQWIFDFIQLGDYKVEFGKGLILWSPFTQEKNGEIYASHLGFGAGIQNHTGASESLFFRGVAFKVESGFLQLQTFASSRLLDASYDTLGKFISYISLSGYHRTALEVSRKNSISERVFGNIIGYSDHRAYDVRILVLHEWYSLPFDPSLGKPENSWSGSFSFNFMKAWYGVSGEAAIRDNKMGVLANVKIIPSKQFSWMVSYRKYESGFGGIHSSPVKEYSSTAFGEEGLYLAFKCLYKKFIFGTFVDQFRTLAPDAYGLCYTGNDFLTFIHYQYSKDFDTKLTFRYMAKELATSNLLRVEKHKQNKYALFDDFSYLIDKTLRVKHRIAYIAMNFPGTSSEEGFLSFIDLRWLFYKKTSLSARFYFFHTDSFTTGFFESESELPGMYPISSLYNDGCRYYLLLRSELVENLSCSLKIGTQIINSEISSHKDKEELGLRLEYHY